MTLLVSECNDENTDRACALDSFEITRIWEGQKPKIKLLNNIISCFKLDGIVFYMYVYLNIVSVCVCVRVCVCECTGARGERGMGM